jgi:aldose 1-epimerase
MPDDGVRRDPATCAVRRLQALGRQLHLSAPAGPPATPPHPAHGEGAAAERPGLEYWGEVRGQAVYLVRLRSASGVEAAVLSYGCVLQSVVLPPNRNNRVEAPAADVVLGYDTLAEYEHGKANFGSIVGRCANRIPDGAFELDGVAHTLTVGKAGEAHLHGGPGGLFSRVFSVVELSQGHVALEYLSPAGEEGYPGALAVRFVCRLSDAGALTLEYDATTDAPTIVNLTNHSYWNLAGHGSGESTLDHRLELHCAHYTPTEGGHQGAPTGEVAAVAGTPFDLRPRPAAGPPPTIGELTRDVVGVALAADGSLVESRGGVDNAFVIDRPGGPTAVARDPAVGPVLALAARYVEPRTGRWMEVATTAPAIQVHTANNIDGDPALWAGKGGALYQKHHGINLETQNLPNAINTPHFPSPILRPGEAYHHVAVHTFGL